jgi:hypothetical protein
VSMMGCFTVFRSKKKKVPLETFPSLSKKPIDARESTSSRLPEPEVHAPSLQSAPPSFRNRAKIAQSAGKVTNSRARVLSAPSTLVVVDQFGFPYEFKDQDDSRDKEGSMKGHRFSNPLPLPLPSPEGNSLRKFGSFKTSNVSGPLEVSGPLPLPPKKRDGLRVFSYEEVSSACQWFSADQRVSETLSSTSYKATFRDGFADTRATGATVARLPPSTQVQFSIDLVIFLDALAFLDQSANCLLGHRAIAIHSWQPAQLVSLGVANISPFSDII